MRDPWGSPLAVKCGRLSLAQAAERHEVPEIPDDDGQQPAEPQPRIRSRADLHRVYAGYSRSELCHEFLLEDGLQTRIRLLVDVTAPLHYEFVAHLEAHKRGPDYMLKWHAQRSIGAYANQTICETLNLLSKEFMCDRRDPSISFFQTSTGLVRLQ